MSKKLNLGCGTDIKDTKRGWVNLDSADLPGVDVVHDLDVLPLPFPDSEFTHILCQSVVEHTEYIPLLKELHRILEKGGTIKVQVPHFTSATNFIDPTHRRMFSVRTFQFFVKDSSYSIRAYYFDFQFASIQNMRIVFEKKGLFFYNRIIERIVNSSPTMQHFYEDSFLSRLFPAFNIVLTLVK